MKNIKLKVETDEQNQKVFEKMYELYGHKWVILLVGGDGGWSNQGFAYRAVCSRWKGFRHFAINNDNDFILFVHKDDWEKRKEKEVSFEEFMQFGNDEIININGKKYKLMEEE